MRSENQMTREAKSAEVETLGLMFIVTSCLDLAGACAMGTCSLVEVSVLSGLIRYNLRRVLRLCWFLGLQTLSG